MDFKAIFVHSVVEQLKIIEIEIRRMPSFPILVAKNTLANNKFIFNKDIHVMVSTFKITCANFCTNKS
jgi:hypothetical protein